ncbi:hypothetical protein [Actinomadura napierensis]|uniref:Uncharacterized protein n=1 Tax=Actinomadura napierensis TaxID=267854 RepID=A0ABP5KX65_9ACTN
MLDDVADEEQVRPPEALDLLRKVVGADRVDADPDAAARIAARCGGRRKRPNARPRRAAPSPNPCAAPNGGPTPTCAGAPGRADLAGRSDPVA